MIPTSRGPCAQPLEQGELVLLLTDGVVEANNPEQTLFGYERAIEVVPTPSGEGLPATSSRRSNQAVLAPFTGNKILFDDVTCLVVPKVGEMGEGNHLAAKTETAAVQAVTSSTPSARQLVGQSIHGSGESTVNKRVVKPAYRSSASP